MRSGRRSRREKAEAEEANDDWKFQQYAWHAMLLDSQLRRAIETEIHVEVVMEEESSRTGPRTSALPNLDQIERACR